MAEGPNSANQPAPGPRLAGRIAHGFIDSKLTPLVIVAALLLGAFSILWTPREEEPQIVVPMLDVFVQMPGASPEEISQRVSLPMEKLLREVPGVEYIYSISQPGMSMLIVRFYVGSKEEDAIIQTYNKLYSNFDRIPPGASQPIIKTRSINDVPIIALTLWGKDYDSYRLRRIAGEVEDSLKQLDDVSETAIIGGQPRQIRVVLDTQRLAAYGLTPAAVAGQLQGANSRAEVGSFARDNREFKVEAGKFFTRPEDLQQVVVGIHSGRPVYLRDVVEKLEDGPAEPDSYVMFANARGGTGEKAGAEYPAVTITLAKRKGTNATIISERVLEKVNALRGYVLPNDLSITVTRNYGETAKDKSNELLKHLLIATLSVTLLIALALGWRESGVVLLAVPVTLALTLAVFYFYGYTLNRVTLFALIFSIGILVDDAIVVVENIVRHFRLPGSRGRPLAEVAVEAVDEVGNPTILATFAVIGAILPMAFVRGLMGPYMRPIPVGASAAMLFSLVVAFVVSPWAALRLLRNYAGGGGHDKHDAEGWTTRLYRRVMNPLILDARRRWMFLGGVVVLLLAAVAFVPLKWVRVKMLPFDNKSEFQVLVDQDEGTPLEVTLETARQMSRALAAVPEVADVQTYAGTAAPYNFNGLVLHYFLRHSANGADLQVNLVDKGHRSLQSHDLAKKVRPVLLEIAKSRRARVKVIEIPPGPPVLDTLVAEIYGPSASARENLAEKIRGVFETTPGIVDVDDSSEAHRDRVTLVLDREKAGLKGVSASTAVETIGGPGAGRGVGRLDVPASREPVPVWLRLSAADRGDLERRLAMRVEAAGGSVALGQLARVERTAEPQPILHKDLKPVTYVFGDLAGQRESPVYALAALNAKIDALPPEAGARIERYAVEAPSTSDRLALKWDGEWQITYEVFRDLGIAFAIVLVLIAILVIGWFQSFSVPFAILLPIPLSLIGILPGHFIFGAFFTATSMIGFIAGAGIIVRNSIILVDFIELKLRQGMPLAEAVVEAGAVRFRPMLLTAAAVVVGSLVILFDPIFQGLAISLMMGEVAATLLSRMAVPVVYYLIARRGRADILRQEGLTPNIAS